MSDLVSQIGAPPGWYADPYGRAIHRYFNGAAWTPYVVDAAGQQSTEAPPGPISLAGALPANPGGIVIQNIVQAPQPAYAVPMTAGQPGTKSPGLAVGLAAVFGPLGVLYVNVGVAVVLTVLWLLTLFTLIVPFGIWVGGMAYAYTEANRKNLRRLAMAAGPQPIHGGLPPVQTWQPAPPPPPVMALPTPSFASMPPPPPPTVGPLAAPAPSDDTLPFA